MGVLVFFTNNDISCNESLNTYKTSRSSLSAFQALLEGQAGHASTGILLRSAALCWGREEPGILHLTTEIKEFQTTMQRLDVLD